MMGSGRNFPAIAPLYDVTIPSLAPGASGVQTPVTGAFGVQGDPTYLYVTPNVLPNNSGALPSGVVAEALTIEVTSPVVQRADGSIVYPDFGFWPVADQTDLQRYQNYDGSYGTNMMPARESTVGRHQVKLGVSIRRVLTEARNGHPRSSMALVATGIKYVSSLIMKLASVRGWGIAGDIVITPARIRISGERYTQDMLNILAGGYEGRFVRQSLRREIDGLVPIVGSQGGKVTLDGWTGLPGGYNQTGGSVVHRYFNYATNQLQTGAQVPFLMTNNQGVGGAQGNVGQNNDLGFAFGPTQGSASQARDALIVQQFGVASGIANIAWAGFQVNGNNVPDPNGFPVSYANNHLAYGQVGPIRNNSGLFFAMPEYEGELEIQSENAGVFITANGTAVAANAATVAVGGVRITLG